MNEKLEFLRNHREEIISSIREEKTEKNHKKIILGRIIAILGPAITFLISAISIHDFEPFCAAVLTGISAVVSVAPLAGIYDDIENDVREEFRNCEKRVKNELLDTRKYVLEDIINLSRMTRPLHEVIDRVKRDMTLSLQNKYIGYQDDVVVLYNLAIRLLEYHGSDVISESLMSVLDILELEINAKVESKENNSSISLDKDINFSLPVISDDELMNYVLDINDQDDMKRVLK